MRNLSIYFCFVVFSIFPVHIQAAEHPTDEAQLQKLKKVLWQKAYREQDTQLLNRILADEFYVIDANGIWSSKADELEWIRTNKPSYDSLVYDLKRLEIFENGTAILAGIGTIRGTSDKGPYVAEYHSTNVFIKRNGAWEVIASHISGYKHK